MGADFISLRICSSPVEATLGSYLTGYPFLEVASQWLPSLPPQRQDKRSRARQNISHQRFRFQYSWAPLPSTLKAQGQTHQLRFPCFLEEIQRRASSSFGAYQAATLFSLRRNQSGLVQPSLKGNGMAGSDAPALRLEHYHWQPPRGLPRNRLVKS